MQVLRRYTRVHGRGLDECEYEGNHDPDENVNVAYTLSSGDDLKLERVHGIE